MLKRVALVVVVLLVGLLAVLLLRTVSLSSRQPEAEPVAVDVDADAVAQHLAAAVRIATISHQEREKMDRGAFLALHQLLADTYPGAHATLTRETVNDLALLYTWQGTDAALPPVVLMCHMDVVPVTPGTEKDWTHPPFAGVVDDEFVWGRGTLDDKVECITILEAVEALVAAGFAPRRTLLLAYGHDEEISGRDGAQAIVALLKQRGVRPDFVVDEGSVVIEPKAVGADKPIALIAVAEKGYATFELRAVAEGGHSSMPPKETAVGILSRAMVKLEDNPMPAALEGLTADFFAYVAPEMPFAMRVPMANLWLFGPLIRQVLAGSNAGNAVLRTTTAPTMLRAGVKENVLAQEATAIVNFRIKPGDTTETVAAHVRDVVADDRVAVRLLEGASEPSPVSPVEHRGYQLLARTVAEVIPEAAAAPQLMIGASDSRFFYEICDAIYRFMPLYLAVEDTARIHGTNERVKKSDLARAVVYYRQLLRHALSE